MPAKRRSRSRLFGKPISNPADEAANVAEAAKSALSAPKSEATTAESVAAGSEVAGPVVGTVDGEMVAIGGATTNMSTKPVDFPGSEVSARNLPTSGSLGGVSNNTTMKATEWVPGRGRRAVPLALGAVGLVGLTGLQAFASRGEVEDNLRKQSIEKLKDEFPDLKVRIEGRDAYLEGTVVDGESRKRAHDLVREIKGVRHVKDPKVVSPAPAQVAAEAQVLLTIDTIASLDTAADGMASIAEVTGDSVSETTIVTPAVTTAAPAVAADSVPVETTAGATVPPSDPAPTVLAPTTLAPATPAPTVLAPTTLAPTTLAPTTLAPTTLAPTTLAPTTVVPASVLASSVPTTIVVAPASGEPVATVVPVGEPVEPIRFARASTDLDSATAGEIDRIAAFLSANPNVEIGVAGYADSRGTKLQNMAISKVRAENVRQALIDRGIPGSRIKAVWFGDRSPVADNATEDGRAFNRRVEFRFFDAAIDATSAYGQDVSFTG